jgi:hypothetical protein
MVISQFSSLPLFAEVRGRVLLRSTPGRGPIPMSA